MTSGVVQDGEFTHWGVPINSQEDIDAVLAMKTWAVVGLGNNPERAAYGVSKLLQDKGHHIIPVYPRAETVHERLDTKLSQRFLLQSMLWIVL